MVKPYGLTIGTSTCKYLQMKNQENIAYLEIFNRESDYHSYLWF